MAVIATGGMVSRFFITNDKGKTWQPSSPLMLQGSKTGGIFSLAFRNRSTAILAGGDFADSLARQVSMFTTNGGRDWQVPERPPRGTRWCAEFIGGSTAVAVGPTGGDITFDDGRTWTALFDEPGFHVVRKSRTGSLVIVAGRKSKLAVLR
jgi:photosystem II stability/assembly factor-like uncharacterized protein